ncbi:hypothetical protein [Streptomyces sp. HD]|uniref:hypothetical protein n=1 Tax=Streptomyces sp. HD TaxID=3020892 RepID=UPI00233080CD|nr:hypothetical protein [Streptomyces sp. HD]MDC0769275.1 hypothetical protein [Streptomyces sp. HD]
MSDATGTVIAAVIAFAAAVIGAVIAGMYAKRGAEAGGRKAVEAALAQVHGQAAAEHWQWVRSQRHQAFAALLEAYAALDEVLVRITPEVRGGAGLDEATGREFRERTVELKAKTSQLALWGPNEANVLAYAVTGKSMAAVGAFMQAAGGSSSSLSVDWSGFDQARGEMTQFYASFLQRAGEIIRDPLQPVS